MKLEVPGEGFNICQPCQYRTLTVFTADAFNAAPAKFSSRARRAASERGQQWQPDERRFAVRSEGDRFKP